MNLSWPSTTLLQSSDVHIGSDVVADLTRWLTEQIKNGAASAVLVQRAADGGHQAVNQYDLVTDPVDTHALAELIYGTALRDAHTLRQSITYIVVSVRGEAERLARYPFRIDIGSGGWLQQADIPAERALIAMLMNHTELSARMSIGHSTNIIDQYRTLLDQANTYNARLLAQAQTRIATLEGREHEALELRDKVQAMTRQRDIEADELKRRHELRMSALDKVGGVVPLMFPGLARAMGTQAAAAPAASPSPAGGAPPAAGPAAPTPEVEAFALLKQLIQSLSDKQFQSLTSGVLEPHQVQILGRIYEIIQASLAAAPTGSSSGGSSSPAPAAAAAAAAPSAPPAAPSPPPSPPSTSPDPTPRPTPEPP